MLVLLGLIACSRPPAAPTPGWSLGFYIPYDNDLGRFAPAVLDAITEGTAGGVPAIVLVDTPADDGVVLYTCADGRCVEERPAGVDNSSDIESFDIIINALKSRVTRRYGLVIMGHGGGPSELALDERPGAGAEARWMALPALAGALREHARSGLRLDLLDLQVCSRASLQVLYELREAAPTVLASELPVASPNLWPRQVLPALAAHPEWTGEELAAAIVAATDARLYGSWSCVRTAGLEPLVSHLAARPAPPLDAVSGGLYGYGGQGYVDLGWWLRAVDGDTSALDPVFCGHWQSPGPEPALLQGAPEPSTLGGLGLASGPTPGLAIEAVPGWSAARP